MAGDTDGASDCSSRKFKFKCCKTQVTTNLLSIKCGGIYHSSCAERDVSGITVLEDSRVICCGTINGTIDDLFVADKTVCELHQSLDELKHKLDKVSCEKDLLREIISEVQDKNRILIENNNLLVQRISDVEKKHQQKTQLTTPTNVINSKINKVPLN
ncbi:hypothetical protein WA026_019303 [Henosepilachna vigintioctopunctata]|uniref:Uncharacterized protein n=1 Tax=Henosepilachna vigintioctopunctata TaxID=420089 RepID=A0AAW1U979_9CUCU